MDDSIKNEDKSPSELYLDPETKKFKEGNPGGGRPKGSISIVSRLKEIFEEDPAKFESYCEDILKDPKMKRDVMDQIDGRPRQAVEVSGGSLPFIIQIIKDDGNTGNKES